MSAGGEGDGRLRPATGDARAASLVERIRRLDDEAALRALALVVDGQGVVLATAAVEVAEARVAEALSQPEMAELASEAGDGDGAGEGEVARATLAYLVEETGFGADVERALSMGTAEGERLEPLSLAVGALVLFALRSEVELRKDPGRGWSFHFHHRPLSDSALGTIFAKLLGASRG